MLWLLHIPWTCFLKALSLKWVTNFLFYAFRRQNASTLTLSFIPVHSLVKVKTTHAVRDMYSWKSDGLVFPKLGVLWKTGKKSLDQRGQHPWWEKLARNWGQIWTQHALTIFCMTIIDGFDIFISTCLLLPLEGTTTSFMALGSSQRHVRNFDERRYECDTLGSPIMDILKLESKLSTFCLLKV